MSNSYDGVIVLTIWNQERSKYTQLYRNDLSLSFQPEKGMKLVSKTNNFVIHDIEWDIEDGTFRAKIVQIERYAGDSFLDMDFLIGEAERVGWEYANGKSGRVVEDPNEEFKDYCFPFDENKYLDELDQKTNEERFKEVVLDWLTSIQSSVEALSASGIRSALTGAIVGAATFISMNYLF